MKNDDRILQRQRGFTLTELAIVMGILGVLVAGLFQLTTASNRQVQDQVTAQQIQQYLKATRSYLTAYLDSSGNLNGVATAIGTPVDITTAVRTFRTGLADTSPQGGTYHIVLRRVADITTPSATNYPAFSVAFFTTGGNKVQRVSLGTIASLVGADGAGLYCASPATPCNYTTATITSAFGAVSGIPAANYNTGTASPEGEKPGALTYVSTLELGSDVSKFLSRETAPAYMTTMQTDLMMGSGASVPTSLASSAGYDIVMTDNTNDIEMAGGTIGDRLGGTLNFSSSVAMGTNSLTTIGSITASGNVTLTAGTLAAPTITGINSAEWSNGVNIGTMLTPGGVAGLLVEGPATVDGELRAQSFIYDSDRRLKDNIEPLQNPLEKLLKINGVTYVLKASGQRHVGVIAQDVEKVFPELISVNSKGMKGVDYGALVAPLIEAIRVLDNDNKALKARVEKLEAKDGF